MQYASIMISGIAFFGSILAFIYLIAKKKKEKNTVSTDGKKDGSEHSETDKFTTNLLPIRNYDAESQCFCMRDNTYMDLMEITCKDLVSASEDENNYDCLKFTKFYKTYADDIKLISLNFPSNTKKQQKYFNYKIERTKNRINKKWLQQHLLELLWIEKNKTNREFYFMIFAESLEDLYQKRNIITSTLISGKRGLINFITQEKKEQILYKINNKNSLIL